MHRNFALLALPVLALSILVTTPEPADFQRLLVIKGATSDLIQTSALVGDEGSRASSKAESAFGEKEKEQNATTHNSATAITPSPAAILLSNFKSMVATAREEGAINSKRPSMKSRRVSKSVSSTVRGNSASGGGEVDTDTYNIRIQSGRADGRGNAVCPVAT